jgi:calcineurin-like phosphoesterase family protein
MLDLDEQQEALLKNVVKVCKDSIRWSVGTLTWKELEERKSGEHQEFIHHLEEATIKVQSWPEWKRNLLGDL